MSEAFKVGTVVYLKTGSPPMVVVKDRADHLVSVRWFDKQGTMQSETFEPECIFAETPDLKYFRDQRLGNMKAHMVNGSIEGLEPRSEL